jgi:hypothetical protein
LVKRSSTVLRTSSLPGNIQYPLLRFVNIGFPESSLTAEFGIFSRNSDWLSWVFLKRIISCVFMFFYLMLLQNNTRIRSLKIHFVDEYLNFVDAKKRPLMTMILWF